MTRRTTKRKTNTALVHNPSRGLSLGSGRRTTVRKAARKANGVRKAVAKTNPARRRSVRRSNPATMGGLLSASIMTGLAVSILDLGTSYLLPSGSALIRIGTKGGLALLFQSKFGTQVPIVGKYNKEIALVLGVSAVVDVTKLVVMPYLQKIFTGLQGQLVAAPAAAQIDDGTTAGLYNVNQAYQPIYA